MTKKFFDNVIITNKLSYFSTVYFKIKRRIIFLAFGIVSFLIAYCAGAAIHIGNEQADDLRQHFSEQIKGIDQNGIFVNNARIALFMFLPAAGIGVGGFVGFNTGMIFTAIAEHSSLNNVSPLVILITPFGIMEVFAYGIAISRSGLLIYQLVKLIDQIGKKRLGREFIIPSLIEIGIPALIEIGIIILILFAGAMIEWQIITQFGGAHSVPKI